jgi:hypothetical protein
MLPPEGEKKQLEILRNKSGEERLKISFNLNRLVKRIMEDGIRYQFPNISPEELKKQILLRTKSE